MVIYTFGYRSHTHHQLLGIIESIGAGGIVVDVRRNPTACNPHWTSGELRDLLRDRYLPMPELGNDRMAARGEWKVIDNAAGLAAIEDLIELYRHGSEVVLLCAELHNRECHRRQVASYLQRRLIEAIPGATVEIKHLM